MRYKTLGFSLHRKCNASCDMCCFECNPNSKEVLDYKRIKEYIAESKEIEDIKTISFTGGEPFLEYEKLYDLVSFSKECNKHTACITNAYWAKSYNTAYELLAQLKEVGLTKMNISHDAFHKQYVPTSFVKNALYALRDLGIPVTLGMIRLKDEDIGGTINDLGDALYSANLQVFPCYPSGGALNSFGFEQFDRTLKPQNMRCIYDGNMVVLYDGTIYPCCSQVIIETGLSIGNFNDISLKEALKKTKNNALLHFLRTKELDFFMEYAKENLDINIPSLITNPCEICGLLFKKENLEKFIPYVLEQIQPIMSIKEEKNA